MSVGRNQKPEVNGVSRTVDFIRKDNRKATNLHRVGLNRRCECYDLDPLEIIELIEQYGDLELVKLCELYAYNEWYPNRKSYHQVGGYRGCGRTIDVKRTISKELGYSSAGVITRRLTKVKKILKDKGYGI